MARLSVNLNKVALLRNSRHTGVPDLLSFARSAIDAGAAGITVHPRPDERHIRREDVFALAKLMQSLRPSIELNLEGYPDMRFLGLVAEIRPEQCTLVPDAPSAFTSETGWTFDDNQSDVLFSAIRSLKEFPTRVILFIDPDPKVVDRVKDADADGVEIYTGTYAAAFRKGEYASLLNACHQTAREARARDLIVNVGHDLNLRNLAPLLDRIPFLAEASIGHELTADALLTGFAGTVRNYAAVLAPHSNSA